MDNDDVGTFNLMMEMCEHSWKEDSRCQRPDLVDGWRRDSSDRTTATTVGCQQKEHPSVPLDDSIDFQHTLQVDAIYSAEQNMSEEILDVNVAIRERFSSSTENVSGVFKRRFVDEEGQDCGSVSTQSSSLVVSSYYIKRSSATHLQKIHLHRKTNADENLLLAPQSVHRKIRRDQETIGKDHRDDSNALARQPLNYGQKTIPTSLKDLPEHDCRQRTNKSCPSTILNERSTINNNQEDILAPFRTKLIAILAGSATGLASVGLQSIVKRYTNLVLPGNDRPAWNTIEKHFHGGLPRIRPETVSEVLQQYIDPNLSLLDDLMSDSPVIDRSHDVLANLARTSTVIATNFDPAIEDAGRSHCENNSTIAPIVVRYLEKHFKKAYQSISTANSMDLTGLWMIRGTVAVWKDSERTLLRVDDDGGPVATLTKMSLIRESVERRYLLHHLLETRPFIIVNYSATDGFDVTRWLKTVPKPLNVLWIQQVNTCVEPTFYNGADLARSVDESITPFDRGLTALACAWHERGVADRLTVVTTVDSIGFLSELTQLTALPVRVSARQADLNAESSLSPPIEWQSCIVSGAMLCHLSYYSEAKRYFERAARGHAPRTREYCLAKLAAAEAAIEIGDRNERIQAMEDACEIVRHAPPAYEMFSVRKSRLICATVKRFVEKDGQAIAISVLQQLLDECGNPEYHFPGRERNVALEAATLLKQLRRYLPLSAEPSDIVKQWIEAVPQTGLLHTKGMHLHESALAMYQSATTPEELDDAIETIEEATEIREEIGHMRGLVASSNVSGFMRMRRAEWNPPFEMPSIQRAAKDFRLSIDYSDKHASVFDQFQARIHLIICLLRFPSMSKTPTELNELLTFLRTRTTDDLRTQIENEFCLAMSVFTEATSLCEELCDRAGRLFDELVYKYSSNDDVRLIRIVAAARFNSEMCQDWKRGQAHQPNPELTRDITTRKAGTSANAYWHERIRRAERNIPRNQQERLQLLLDPLSP